METCTFFASGARNWKVTRESASIRGYWTSGKLYGEACAAKAGALGGLSGAGTNSRRGDCSVLGWARLTADRSGSKANDVTNECSAIERFIDWSFG